MADAAPAAPDAALVKLGEKLVPRAAAERAVQVSGSWFWWLAALSLINSLAAAGAVNYRMVLGLGFTQLLDRMFPLARAAHWALVLAIAGLFVVFGYCARRGSRGWYLAGMVVYALDALIFLPAQDWEALAFHVFVLYMLWRGFAALRALRRHDAGNAAAAG